MTLRFSYGNCFLSFPRIERKRNRSLADFFRPEGDIIGIQVVTIGKGIGERSRRYISEKNSYTLGFYLNGIGNYLTEQLAERVTGEIRRGLFLNVNKENVTVSVTRDCRALKTRPNFSKS